MKRCALIGVIIVVACCCVAFGILARQNMQRAVSVPDDYVLGEATQLALLSRLQLTCANVGTNELFAEMDATQDQIIVGLWHRLPSLSAENRERAIMLLQTANTSTKYYNRTRPSGNDKKKVREEADSILQTVKEEAAKILEKKRGKGAGQ